MLTLYSFGELRVAVHMNTNDETPPSMRLFQWNSTLVCLVRSRLIPKVMLNFIIVFRFTPAVIGPSIIYIRG